MNRQGLLFAGLSALVAALFLASLLTGPAGIGPGESLAALFRGGDDLLALVMRELRLPRAILGLMVGAALGMAGAVLQGFLRNPLAEPGLIGTSASAALGAVLAIQTGLSAAFPLGLPLAALAGAALSVLLVLMLAGPRGGTLALILAGIAISALAGAATSLVLNLSPNPFAINEIVFWMMGSLADRSMLHVWIAAPFMLLGFALLWPMRPALEALTLGEDAAASSGVHLGRLRLMLVAGIAALIGGATAVAGTVGFVGLVVPHVLRRAVGASPARLVPAAALGGAATVLAADIAVRWLAPGRDLKLGVLTALVGAPFFLHLILKTRREGL
ncbi:FecCD family ABC transporter permease [Paracoccus sp. P2]|uniref:Iron ABC transporter permease n=1 Tax=Paracoccus pantotrophus TaxID=82367 RepID=A0A1I5DEL5_PARPN|nr:iron ABC transporter permease [Paracoccus pantotrophus]MDF3853986.1 iron ABC transporter permease [Paracoccus pantotrophus]QFG35119.1 iron ABC transporter permease [Paracoccus pantotrophus]QLH13360.1 iron ABC transporter permease [Paracoccus pantotrophus]RDD99253.1 iron ABC transporter permease [Paracoccus pantotrophus]RKS44700.1 iron complex transport system permease protein [Paracoccus pantotrophus]